MRNRNTVEYLGVWEQLYNPNFKPIEFDRFKSKSGEHAFTMSPEKWINGVSAVGMVNKRGRYGGGTFAHSDIAFEFASWISAEFKLYVIKDYHRLKSEESQKKSLDWNLRREISKLNYKIQTDAIKENRVVLIEQGYSQSERLIALRHLAERQLKGIGGGDLNEVKKLEG